MVVGLIGLGRMGTPMAARIAAAGHRLIGYDIAAAKRQQKISDVEVADDVAHVAADVDVVITSLPGPAEVDDVMNGPSGLLQLLKPGAIVVETSTISPQQSQSISNAFSARGVFYLDAPISGGVQGARNGTLATMVGGPTEVLGRVHPTFPVMPRRSSISAPFAGNMMKLVIQSIFLSQMAVFLEAISMGEKNGIA